ncbi:GumC family protein [Chondromyces crocatus]|uniref:Protein kinase involved in polysaccharide biosynthesis n=1 Tax=Chondromyces crocatus TaxID=52 RepID=A0A0K1EA77_CHOCO|nr:protein kinase [Chondromyces crocatus]AKT37775.1 protein kinase involved in polysaccharide biosynthesis [Chondromyces crocatus]
MDSQTFKRHSPPPPAPEGPLAFGAEPPQAAGPQPPSIGGMIRRTLAHWYIAVIVAVLGAGMTALYVKSRQPAYRSETTILYREGVRAALGPDGPDPLRTLSGRLKETLLARSNLEKIVTEFELYPDVLQKRGIVDAVDRLRSKVTFRAKSPDTFAISFEGMTRDEAQIVTARLAELLVEETARVKQSQAKITTEFLIAQQKQAEQELEKADKDLAQFLSQHPEFAQETVQPTGVQSGASIRAEQRRATEGDPMLAALERQIPRLRSQLNPAAPAPGSPAAAAAQPPAALTQQKSQADQELASARRDLADKQSRFTDSHPDVRTASTRVATAEAAARRAEQALASWQPEPPPEAPAAAGTATAKATTNKAAVQAQLSQLEREISQRKKSQQAQQGQDPSDAAQQIINVEAEWSRLTRDQNRARIRLGDLEQKVFRAEMTANSEEGGYAAQIMVLDPAYKPTSPSTPPRSMMALGGLAASFLMGLALAAARGIVLDDRVYGVEDIERLGLAPVLSVVPAAPGRRWRLRG